jgi:hypothetical protein
MTIARVTAFECIDPRLARLIHGGNQAGVSFHGGNQARVSPQRVPSEMMGAQDEQQDDRERNADQPQEDGTHSSTPLIPAAAKSFGLLIGSITRHRCIQSEIFARALTLRRRSGI